MVAEDSALPRALPRFLEELADLHLHGLFPVRNGDGVADHEHRPIRHQHRRRRRNDVVPPRRLPPNHPSPPQPQPRRGAPFDLERGQVDAAGQEREQLPRREVPQAALEDDGHLIGSVAGGRAATEGARDKVSDIRNNVRRIVTWPDHGKPSPGRAI